MKLNQFPSRCPVCSDALRVTELACPGCDTSIRGTFGLPLLAQLPSDLQEFIVTFVTCRGNIREVEKALGVSYPTVRNRLESAIEALGRTTPTTPPSASPNRSEILASLERGELSAAEAIAKLEDLNP
ncbi:MAG TPA: DUF2089 domain-containing protein [Pantanalinema sp.]